MRPLSLQEQRRAVSPVIGVILMVAITVILAAVIGAFVLEIGDQQETAPSTSFDIEESINVYKGQEPGSLGDCLNGCETNLTEVRYSHAGGDTLDIDQVDVKVDGNDSSFGDPGEANTYNTPGNDPSIAPQPNTFLTRGTNEQITLGSGESWSIIGYKGMNPENLEPSQIPNDRRLRWAIRDNEDYYCTESDTGPVDGSTLSYTGSLHNPTIYLYWGATSEGACVDDLDEGNEVSIVWTAESGGKTQNLISYTVQQSNANS